MKKTYIQPDIEILVEEPVEMLAISGVGNDDYGIGYGGVDENGSLDPAARESMFGE